MDELFDFEQEYVKGVKEEFIKLEIQNSNLETVRTHYVARLRQCNNTDNTYCLLSIGLMEVVNYFMKLNRVDSVSRYLDLAKRTNAWIKL